mgnify:CR=1 FL=1
MAFPNMSTKNKKTGITFGQAFKNARKRGAASFMFNGKPFSTKTKDEVSKKNTRKAAKAARKKARIGKTKTVMSGKGMTTKKTKTTMKERMAARKKGRVAARKIKKGNKALRKYS